MQHWLELKTHFSVVRNSEDDYTSEMLNKMYADEKHLVYFLFLLPMSDVQRVNKMFESKTIDHLKLLDELVTLLKTIGKTLVLLSSRCNFLVDNVEEYLNAKPYLGYRFEKKIKSLIADKLITKSEEIGVEKNVPKVFVSTFQTIATEASR